MSYAAYSDSFDLSMYFSFIIVFLILGKFQLSLVCQTENLFYFFISFVHAYIHVRFSFHLFIYSLYIPTEIPPPLGPYSHSFSNLLFSSEKGVNPPEYHSTMLHEVNTGLRTSYSTETRQGRCREGTG